MQINKNFHPVNRASTSTPKLETGIAKLSGLCNVWNVCNVCNWYNDNDISLSFNDRSITNDSASFPDQGGQTHNLTVREILQRKSCLPVFSMMTRWFNPGEEEHPDGGEHQQSVRQADPDGRAVHLHWEPVLPWLGLCLAHRLQSKTFTFTRHYLAFSF